jgi:TDG/mug DNA glycosylase family protein
MAAGQSQVNGLIVHPFAPVFDEGSKILILGTMPSRMSRQQGFYYGHPQNRFWLLLSVILQVPEPRDIDCKRSMLLQHGIALWDVLKQCEIKGSQDSSIRQPEANDLGWLLSKGRIRRIFANGQTAAELYRKFTQPLTGRPCLALPSTSPANGRWSLDALVQAWQPLILSALWPDA